MKKFLLATAVAISTVFTLTADPQPYANIRNLPYVPYFFEDGYLLINLINENSVNTFIDVGSKDGSASRYVAQNTPDVVNFSINPWWSCDKSQKQLFQRFLSNVRQENNQERIIPIRMGSLEGARALDIIADLIYLGSSTQGIGTDIIAWSTHLSSSGIICGHEWQDPYVETGVSQAAAKLGLQVHSNGNFWYLKKN